MKLLKYLLGVFTVLAVVLTGTLVLLQGKAAPRYVQIYNNSDEL